MKKLLLLSTLCFLTGCVSTTRISEVSDGFFSASKEGSAYSSPTSLLQDVYEDAQQYCAKQGKKLKVLKQSADGGNMSFMGGGMSSVPTNDPAGAFAAGFQNGLRMVPMGRRPSVSVSFTCIESLSQQNTQIDEKRYVIVGRLANGSKRYLDTHSFSKGAKPETYLYSEIEAFPEQQGKEYGGETWGSTRGVYLIDCKTKTYKPLNVVAYKGYTGEGKQVSGVLPFDEPALPIKTEYHQELYKLFCIRKK